MHRLASVEARGCFIRRATGAGCRRDENRYQTTFPPSPRLSISVSLSRLLPPLSPYLLRSDTASLTPLCFCLLSFVPVRWSLCFGFYAERRSFVGRVEMIGRLLAGSETSYRSDESHPVSRFFEIELFELLIEHSRVKNEISRSILDAFTANSHK